MQLAKKILENCILFLPSQCNTNVHNSDHNNITFSFTYIKAKIKLISLGHYLKTLSSSPTFFRYYLFLQIEM